jgi:hypothetical protein
VEKEASMKRIRVCVPFVITVALLVSEPSWQDPLVVPPCSEFMLADSGWVMEMHLPIGMPSNLDGWSLGNGSDTVSFKAGLLCVDYMVLTERDLTGPLHFDRDSGEVYLFEPGRTWPFGMLFYGDISMGMIAAPRAGQSLCYNDQEGFFYLDNTPTLGAPNDAENAMGVVRGTVTDSSGAPIKGVQVMYHDWMGRFVYTDSAGRYEFIDYAKLQDVYFSHPSYVSTGRSLQMWPESTIVLPMVMSRLVSVSDGEPTRAQAVQLSVNYPNPFNFSTTISLTVHRPDFVSCRVYTLQGDEIARLLEGRLNPGTYSVTWSAEGLASGIYLCRVTAGSQTVVRKAVLLK